MDLFIPIFFLFIVIVICSLCGVCCKKDEQGAIYSTPVVVTSQTHQPVGAPMTYQIAPQGYNQQFTTTTMVHQMPYNQPMPMPGPIHSNTVVSPHYPPPQAAMYPPAHSMNPPPYNEVVTNEMYPKQQAYNPNYNSSG